eukprot:TRINITY_DN4974_c0_g2_i1.p1 TRINITY_DN4974_c0_g2~~TRINITY_DN4974_c0_g2_i1.p1  ORF type:complete len:150 (+),score=20.86 TRINITY_DN4974_c0_g2_i1:67-516(+)
MDELQPNYGYAVLATLIAFSLFSIRQLMILMLVSLGAFFTRPENKTFPKKEASAYIDGEFKRHSEQEGNRQGGIFNRIMGGLSARLASSVARIQLRYVFRDLLMCKFCEVQFPIDDTQTGSLLYIGIFGNWINIEKLMRKFVKEDEVKS